jgi:hypothetical protein
MNLCWLYEHVMHVDREFKGHSGLVRLVHCCKCPARFVMSDAHQAFLRYDKDAQFKRDLLVIYPNLHESDL